MQHGRTHGMHEIRLYKGWVLYRAEIDCPGALEFVYRFSKRNTLKRAHAYIDRLYGTKPKPIDTFWYTPDLTEK